MRTALVQRLRGEVLPDLESVEGRLPFFIAAVVALSTLLLTLVFQDGSAA